MALSGHPPPEPVIQVDLIGAPDEADRLRAALGDKIADERLARRDRRVFTLKAGAPFRTVAIDFGQSESDAMLARLCSRQAALLGLPLQVPSVELLYLVERARANIAPFYGEAIGRLLHLKPLIGTLGEAEVAFYRARKKECAKRYTTGRQRFSLSIANEEFFRKSGHIRHYVHDDLHETVAFTPGRPLFRKCKRDQSLARIEIDLFEALSRGDRLRMVQEEFMVIGLERYFIPDRGIPLAEAYGRGMHKTIRDLFVGYFQDFCIDHVAELAAPPFDFVRRFLTAEREGRIRETGAAAMQQPALSAFPPLAVPQS